MISLFSYSLSQIEGDKQEEKGKGQKKKEQ